jgi:AmiR/NasT family two-component response regulator
MSSQQSIEKVALAEWNRSRDLQQEFGKFETYLAYRKAVNSGAVKILSQNAITVSVELRKGK